MRMKMDINKILVIDDEEAIIRVLSISLKSDGFDVVTATSGKEGLKVFQKESPGIVLTDIKMPGMDGIEVLKKIKDIDSAAEVIIITGHGDIDNAIEALKYGASDFINKPIRDEVLTIALERAKERFEIKRKLKNYTINLEREVKVATTELRRRSSFLAKLIKSSNDGIVAADKDLKIVMFNPGAEHIFGYSQQDVIERMSLNELLSADIIDLFEEGIHYDKTTGELPWQDIDITSDSGEKNPVRFAGTYLYEKKKVTGSVAFFQDLREIRRLENQLVRSERLAAIGQTIAGMAHGVKNILHGFKGGSYLVDIGIERNDSIKLKKGWDMIQRNVERTSSLVMDLLSYSKERIPEYEKCYPNKIAVDVCELLENIANENHVEIINDFDDSISVVLMDPRTIHRSLMNIMTNAIDACLFDEDTSKNWRITLKTVQENNRHIRFEITDNGAGMRDEVKEKLFTSFFSTKGHRGTGLGLLVTRKMVEEHNGRISVASRLGEGTTFTIRLPYEMVKD